MTVQENVSLQNYNTFGLAVNARYFLEAEGIVDIRCILKDPKFSSLPMLILGGGSNLLFTKDFDGIVVKIDIKGIQKVKEDPDFVWIKAGAGEIWHDLVLYTIEQGYGGLENLSLIPGTVGAAPMQNIGAYGVEIKDTFEELEAINVSDGAMRTFNHAECEFAYRHSIFKGSLKDQFIISSVTFKLRKNPVFNTSYGDIRETLDKAGIKKLSLKAISNAIVQIRQSKLPDPAKIGNAGSFFKNPSIGKELFDQLKMQYPSMPGYDQPENKIKVPAGWLIEHCGWKGKTIGNVGVHDNQALVLVNRGGAQGAEVKELAEAIVKSVNEKFGIALTPEVNIV